MPIVEDCKEVFIKLQNSIDTLKQYLSVAKYNKNIWKDKYRTFENFCENEIGINVKKVFGVIKAKAVKMPEEVIISNLWHNKLKLNLYLYTLFILLKTIKENRLWPNPDKISFKEWVKTIKVDKSFSVIENLLQGGKYVKGSRDNRDADHQERESKSEDIDKGASKRVYRKADRNKERNGKELLSGSLRREVRKVRRVVASKGKGKR
jgi:hypothetical protein